MILEPVKSKSMAQLSYFIGNPNAGDAAVIDPRRDVDVHLDLSQRHRLRINKVIETHIHADFVSGSRALLDRIGASVFTGRSEASKLILRSVWVLNFPDPRFSSSPNRDFARS